MHHLQMRLQKKTYTSECVPVSFDMSVLFPTDGNPTNPMRATPVFATSNPTPGPDPPEVDGISNSLLNCANLALSFPK